MGYRVTIVNSTDPEDFSSESDLLSPGTVSYTFSGVPTGREYNVTVVAINDVGSSVPAFFTFGE